MESKLGQLFVIGLQGTSVSDNEKKFITSENIGGVILFDRNLESPKQIHQLCTEIQELSKSQPEKAPLFISIDMEGGRVHRLKAPFTQWPALKKIGDTDSANIAFKFAMAMGEELLSVGINLDYAPSVDTLTNSENTVIGDRAIGSDPEQVAKLSSALVRGYIKSGIIPCAKHFPGHGNTVIDSHEDLPIEDTDLETLRNRELIAFKKAFRARLDMVMTAHIRFNQIDPEWPVTLSPKIIGELLREEMRFKNILISDDLDMKALRNHYEVEQIPVQALQAGCDMLLYCNEPDTPPRGLEAVKKAVSGGHLTSSAIEEKYKKVMRLKKDRLGSYSIPPFDDAKLTIGHPDHLKLAKAILDGDIPEDLRGR